MLGNRLAPCVLRLPAAVLLAVVLFASASSSAQDPKDGSKSKQPDFIPAGYDDYQNMLTRLGITKVRKGRDARVADTSDEAAANPFKNTMPELMVCKDGTKVTAADQWPKRRAEIVEDFEREVYGRVPNNVPKVKWEVTSTVEGESGGIATVTKTLAGRVDNSVFPQIMVTIQASFTMPKYAAGRAPIILQFGGGFGVGGRGSANSWTQQALDKGWGYGTINPGSIQGDNNRLREGIIGLTNKGQPRSPEDWGALRAWAWGLSCLIDYFEGNPDSGVDPVKVCITGVSRYGKAALVATAFETRIAAGFVASSGAGGARLFRRDFGELLENLASRGEYHWMAGNFLKYAADEADFGKRIAADLPVDQHQLIALCAPRLCFISYGVVPGDPNWVDARGSFMAAVLAGPAYRLLRKKDLGTPGDYLTDPMPPVNTLIGGELAWRQHSGGHTNVPNFPAFFAWAGRFISSSGLSPSTAADQAVPRTDANSKLAHEQMLESLKNGRIDVYFVGDSITRRWRATDYPLLLANWNENFFGWNAANFGWGADTIQNILWRMRYGELDGVDPKIIVLLAGANNVGNTPASDPKMSDIARGIKALLKVMRAKAPKATIIVMGILPRNDGADPTAVMPSIKRINENIAKFADGKTIRYLNINDKLADKDGKLIDGMTGDGLHLSLKGYQVWADALKPLFMELLGPAAKEDHAPPPTGDPSAAGKKVPPKGPATYEGKERDDVTPRARAR
ncbi:MAG: GDSL-type esterase/lipase family protein [Thermoguttaceae bacterium]